jgi:hypothetical protein
MLTIGAVRFAWPMRYVTSLFFPHEFQQRKPPAPKAKALVHCPDKLSGKFDPEKKIPIYGKKTTSAVLA